MSDIVQSKTTFSLTQVIIKTILFLLTLALGFLLFMHFTPTVVQAVGKPIDVCTTLGGCPNNLSQYKPAGDSPQQVSTAIVGFILQFVSIAIYIASAVSAGFMVFAGYKIITSQGDPKLTEEGYKTLKNAIIGLVLAILSLTIVSLLGVFLTNFDSTK